MTRGRHGTFVQADIRRTRSKETLEQLGRAAHAFAVSISRDHGENWSAPRKISTGKGNRSTVFPFVIAGSKGRVALAWLGSDAETNDVTTAKWKTYFAQTTDALKKDPTWTQVVASDHIVHTGSICLEGLACNPIDNSRALAEVLQMGLTKDGRVIISYPGTGDTVSGWAYVAEQRFGPGMYANVTPTPPAPPARQAGWPDPRSRQEDRTGRALLHRRGFRYRSAGRRREPG